MRKGDGVGILTLQRRAIHEVGRANYPAEILHVWCPPIAPANLPAAGARFEARITPEESILVAEVDRRLAGFGVVAPACNELRAIYVNPDFMRRGVGAALLRELERIAREGKANWLTLDSSLIAERFYLRHGYREIERGLHTFSSGATMACVKMKKELAREIE